MYDKMMAQKIAGKTVRLLNFSSIISEQKTVYNMLQSVTAFV